MTMLACVAPPDLYAGMNSTEKARAIELEAMKRDGQIVKWLYEKVTLVLADDCRYTPDFYVLWADGAVEFQETKGFWRDDAKVKIRVAAAQFPEFRFLSFVARPKKQGGGWDIKRF